MKHKSNNFLKVFTYILFSIFNLNASDIIKHVHTETVSTDLIPAYCTDSATVLDTVPSVITYPYDICTDLEPVITSSWISSKVTTSYTGYVIDTDNCSSPINPTQNLGKIYHYEKECHYQCDIVIPPDYQVVLGSYCPDLLTLQTQYPNSQFMCGCTNETPTADITPIFRTLSLCENDPFTVEVNGQCVCSTNYARDNTGVCSPDSDGDGVPDNKCPAGQSLDLNGVCFADADGDGIPDAQDDNNNDEGQCTGYDNSNVTLIPFTATYSVSDFSYVNMIPKNTCSNYLTRSDIDAVLVKADMNSACPNEYCYAHYVTADCWKLRPADYYPSSNWFLVNAATEAGCLALNDNVTAKGAVYITPNAACDVHYCFILPLVPPEDNNTAPPIAIDANASQIMLDLAPLLAASNRSNELLELSLTQGGKTNNKIDDTNRKLTELNLLQSDQLSELRGLSTKIDNDGIKQRQDVTNNKLDAVNQNLVNQTLAIGTGSGQNHTDLVALTDKLQDLIDKNTTAPSFTIDFGNVDTTDYTSSMSNLDLILGEFSTFGTNIQSDLASINTTYDTTSSLLNQGITVMPHSQITTCPDSYIIRGTTYTTDYCATIAPFSNLIYSLFYVLGLGSIAFTTFAFLFKGGD